MNKKIIAVSAAQGCGKTNITYEIAGFLKKLGKNTVLINEKARECPFPINQTAENRTQSWIAMAQALKELEHMDRYEYVIADRSVLDPICYSLVIGEQDWICNKLIDYLVAHIDRYYKSLYVLDPVAFSFNTSDGVRDTDENFRMNVHDQMIALYDKYNVKYTYIRSSSDIFYNLVKEK